MNEQLEAYLAAQSAGMAIIQGAAGLSAAELVEAGCSKREAEELVHLAQVYFGPTTFTRRQRKAQATTHSLSTLKLIESYAKKVKGKDAAWQLRLKLLALTTSQ
ncbi:MAG: HNH endonuclease, partial [Corynebacterium sp.]|nr:HNH endonuclease [Corynebacterium sp.]